MLACHIIKVLLHNQETSSSSAALEVWLQQCRSIYIFSFIKTKWSSYFALQLRPPSTSHNMIFCGFSTGFRVNVIVCGKEQKKIQIITMKMSQMILLEGTLKRRSRKQLSSHEKHQNIWQSRSMQEFWVRVHCKLGISFQLLSRWNFLVINVCSSFSPSLLLACAAWMHQWWCSLKERLIPSRYMLQSLLTVSYTHLTLPTKRIV